MINAPNLCLIWNEMVSFEIFRPTVILLLLLLRSLIIIPVMSQFQYLNVRTNTAPWMVTKYTLRYAQPSSLLRTPYETKWWTAMRDSWQILSNTDAATHSITYAIELKSFFNWLTTSIFQKCQLNQNPRILPNLSGSSVLVGWATWNYFHVKWSTKTAIHTHICGARYKEYFILCICICSQQKLIYSGSVVLRPTIDSLRFASPCPSFLVAFYVSPHTHTYVYHIRYAVETSRRAH